MQEQVIKQFKEFLIERDLLDEYIKMMTPEKRSIITKACDLLHLFYWLNSDVNGDRWSGASEEWASTSSEEEISVAALYDELNKKEEANMKPELTPEQLGERMIAITNHSQFGTETKFCNLERLVRGDLAHIGDAMIAGEEIICDQISRVLLFSYHADSYSIKPKTIKINIEVPEPMRSFPDHGAKCWISGASEVKSLTWYGDEIDIDIFNYGVFDSKEKAEAYRDALLSALGNKPE